jgi:hypothetical protein
VVYDTHCGENSDFMAICLSEKMVILVSHDGTNHKDYHVSVPVTVYCRLLVYFSFQMAPILSFLISSGSKKKEHRYVCLSEAKASHSHKMWTEVSPSAPHFLQVGLLFSPIIYKCLLKVLYPVSRPIKTLGFVLLKDNNQGLVARSGPEINSQACLCVLQGTRHTTTCW